MRNNFHILFLLTVSLGWISCGISDLTDAATMDFLSQILDMDLVQSDLTSTEEQTLKLKLDKFNTKKLPSCPHFNIAKNFTQFLVKVSSCKEYFGFPDDLNELSSNEYAEKACDLDTWNKFMECLIPSTQNFILGILSCSSIGKNWPPTSGLYQRIQYFLVSTIPTVLESFRNFTCANRRILTMQLDMQLNRDGLEYPQVKHYAKPEAKENWGLSLGICLLKRNPTLFDLGSQSCCDRVSSMDLAGISDCISENDVFGNPKIHDTSKKAAKLFQFMFEKNDGPEKTAFLKTTWEEFCSEESPLSKIFNNRMPRKENMSEKKAPTETRVSQGVEKLRATSLKLEL